ncbi:propionyl-CoA synthetase [Vibrio cyclitrophicus]|uniref:propionyl-CoA synthetase n=1 Tax=Vibrio cyclitrophicus TaxID=47951 RepID=UPI0002DD80CF|nr:propionyl-CoA synthetase [Vibrio cyclitrophicus]OCH40577.1 propionyl-CoA synthetase [Vibrio cyclitrophicus]OEF30738.1 propionyl-CoA synthetase [Vibrio cyclitrophicus 1F97]OEF47960.1 propionyl-CoA synthetase [Vibrio cyclitrophicus 1F273]OEF74172.1 propionyl-CoA synthetase [Vibrio cyclitrophicus 1F111]PMI44275.1 propionyl-CoA synthetase [Vibrio cyclitrophicus]
MSATNRMNRKTDYITEYQWAREDPNSFWETQSQAIDWFESPKTILQTDDNGIERWFPDGVMNTCWLALDYHCENGRGDNTALIYDSPVTGHQSSYTYDQLRNQVAKVAGMLATQGVTKGDRVVIYMPMIPEAAMAMLACARLGAVHSVVFGGFAPHELAVRIEDAEPKVLITASCGIEINKVLPYKPMVDRAIMDSRWKPEKVVVFQREQCLAELNQDRDVLWQQAVADSLPHSCVPVLATDPLYILYTSGTTGKPKGVVRDNGGHAVAMKYSMSTIYDMPQDGVFWAASDVGWVVGHSYIVYAPLIHGCTSILFEGKPVRTPDPGAFWRVCEEYKVDVLFSAPTAFRAIKKEDPEGELLTKYDLSSLKSIFMAGERLDPPTLDWVESHTNKPVIDHWWQTETGWAISANPTGLESLPVKAGSSTKPVPGYQVEILNELGELALPNQQGFVALKRPLPPGCLPTVWRNHDRFESGYLSQFPGYYVSGDGGYLDDEGYLFIMGRIDDVINVAGHRLSTGEMEEIVGGHPAIAECAVVGIHDDLKGQLPLGLVVLKDGIKVDGIELQAELVGKVRNEIGAVACFKQALVVERLPKTRSGKILRRTIRQIAEGEQYVVPSTIDDPTSLTEIAEKLGK